MFIFAVAIAVQSDLVVPEELLVANDADDGQGVLVAGLNIGTGHGHTGQIAVLIQAERVVGGLVDGELTILALLRGTLHVVVGK